MNNRTMVRILVEKEIVSFRTCSRSSRSPHRFIVLRKELERLAENRAVLTKDIHSFAEMRLKVMKDGQEALSICFAWLSAADGNEIAGYTENVLLPFAPFREYLAGKVEEGQLWKQLSLSERRTPRLEFHSRNHLHEVAANPELRHKLGIFISRNLQWPNYTKIVVSDDWIPYSFAFTGYRVDGPGISGGIILHGQENMQKAYYGIHT